MKMETTPQTDDDDLLPEYDLSQLKGGVRGKYFARYNERLRLIRLAADVAPAFADEAAVNAALREYLIWRQERATTASA